VSGKNMQGKEAWLKGQAGFLRVRTGPSCSISWKTRKKEKPKLEKKRQGRGKVGGMGFQKVIVMGGKAQERLFVTRNSRGLFRILHTPNAVIGE